MRLTEILTEKYKKDHECKTPDANYTIEIHDDEVSIKVKLPKSVDTDDLAPLDLEADLHYAVEKVLSKLF